MNHLILTTGPAHAGLIDGHPFLRDLARQELIRTDALGLGIDVDADSRATCPRHDGGLPIFVAGPAARGYFGELMGLPQVADHAAAVAARVLNGLEALNAARCPVS